MEEDKRTEKQILSNIEDYTRETKRNTNRTSRNVAFISWVLITIIVLTAASALIMRMEAY